MRPNLRSLVLDLQKQPGARRFLEEHVESPPGAYLRPVILDISVGCNLDCVFCINTPKSRRAFARDEVFEAVLTQVLPHAAEIAIGCRHEAALHPSLLEWAERLRSAREALEHEPFILLLTSGTLLDPVFGPALARSDLDMVLFSIDSSDPEVYASLRAPATWDELRACLAGFHEAREGSSIKSVVQALLLEETLPHLARTVDDLADLGFQQIAVSQMVYNPFPDKASIVRYDARYDARYETNPELSRVLEDVKERAAARGVDLMLPEPAPPPIPGELFPLLAEHRIWDEDRLKDRRPSICALPWAKLRVDHEGYVYPCQYWISKRLAWGNILEDSLDEIADSAPARETRRALLEGRSPNRTCARCIFGPA